MSIKYHQILSISGANASSTLFKLEHFDWYDVINELIECDEKLPVENLIKNPVREPYQSFPSKCGNYLLVYSFSIKHICMYLKIKPGDNSRSSLTKNILFSKMNKITTKLLSSNLSDFTELDKKFINKYRKLKSFVWFVRENGTEICWKYDECPNDILRFLEKVVYWTDDRERFEIYHFDYGVFEPFTILDMNVWLKEYYGLSLITKSKQVIRRYYEIQKL